MKDEFKSMFNILQKYSDNPSNCLYEAAKNGHHCVANIIELFKPYQS